MMNNLIEYIGEQEGLFIPVISDESITWEKEKQFAILAIANNPYLEKVANQNRTALQGAMISIASIGISLNPASKHAALIPRKGKICLDIMYQGLQHLALSTGSIEFCQTKVVYSNDIYQNNGVDSEPTHNYNAFANSEERGEAVGVYCTVRTSTGAYLTEELNKEEVYKARACSEAYKAYLKDSNKSCPWVSNEFQMWRKTAIKRASSYWPKVDRLNSAIQLLNTDNGEGISTEKDITPKVIENPIQALKDILIQREAKECDYLPWLNVEKFEDITEAAASAAVIKLENAKQ